MEQNPYDLTGMESPAAKQYILDHLATLRLTEAKLAALDAERQKWTDRVRLARSRGEEELAVQAQGEADRLGADRDRIAAEADELRSGVERMRRQLPGLEARRRTIDPDLLEQELLIAAGRMPGDEGAAETERRLAELKKSSGADAALEELKAKMGLGGGTGTGDA